MKISHFSLAVMAATLLVLSTVSRGEETDHLSAILVPGEDWKVVADDIGFSDGASADAEGNFYFSDLKGKPAAIYKIAPDGTKSKVTEIGMSGTKIGPDGRLYACGGAKVIVVDLVDGKQTVLADNLKTNDLAVNRHGQIYITETGKKQVTFVDAKTGQTRAADVGINKPNGIGFLPDGRLLVSDYGGLNVWSFVVQPDGALTDKKAFATMKAPEKRPDVAGGDGMTIDTAGRSYVTTALGLQIFDASGTLLGILPKPQQGALTNAAFAGKDLSYLYLTCGNKVFARKTQVKGALGFQQPVEGSEKK